LGSAKGFSFVCSSVQTSNLSNRMTCLKSAGGSLCSACPSGTYNGSMGTFILAINEALMVLVMSYQAFAVINEALMVLVMSYQAFAVSLSVADLFL
jgi:hypothetical protein